MEFSIYYLGSEQTTWRNMLHTAGVRNVGLSYWAVRKRLPKKRYAMDWGFDSVFLDSGGFSANKEPTKFTAREWRAYGDEYAEFALDHLDDVGMVSEFDCLVLGPAWIEAKRKEVWDHVSPDKFLPIWHPETGLAALEALGERYKRVGIAQDHIAQPGLNITPYLNKLANQGVLLHGLAMSRPDSIRHTNFASVSSTSWLSPAKYGETQVWDGGRLVRYPAKMKDQARLRHRNDFERAGFDVERIMADDPMELVRLSVWSWRQYEASIRGERVTSNGASVVRGSTGEGVTDVAQSLEGSRNSRVALRVRGADEMGILPGLMFVDHEQISADSDSTTTIRLPLIDSKPVRVCNNCFVRTECPKYEPDASCAFEIPIEIKTPMQRKAVMDGLVEMQAQRVAFMRFREELSGGYADPNLSLEFDRLLKTFSVQAELEDDRDFFRMTVESKGKAGVLSRLFGREAGEAANQLPAPMDAIATDQLIGRVIKGSTG